jgi:hypothetical protein
MVTIPKGSESVFRTMTEIFKEFATTRHPIGNEIQIEKNSISDLPEEILEKLFLKYASVGMYFYISQRL